MRWQWSLLALAVAASPALAQQALPPSVLTPNFPMEPAVVADGCSPLVPGPGADSGPEGYLSGNRNFPNFIGYMSNPLFAIDPRAVTEIWPLFSTTSVSSFPALPKGDIQLYGAGLNVALSERLSFGLNQGGYAVSHFDRPTALR